MGFSGISFRGGDDGSLRDTEYFKTASAEDHAAVQKGLERVNMTTFKDRQIGELSGVKKRVFVARALAQGADILLLDEPFAGLDATTEKSLIALLISARKWKDYYLGNS